jgi:hypothetical protein
VIPRTVHQALGIKGGTRFLLLEQSERQLILEKKRPAPRIFSEALFTSTRGPQDFPIGRLVCPCMLQADERVLAYDESRPARKAACRVCDPRVAPDEAVYNAFCTLDSAVTHNDRVLDLCAPDHAVVTNRRVRSDIAVGPYVTVISDYKRPSRSRFPVNNSTFVNTDDTGSAHALL